MNKCTKNHNDKNIKNYIQLLLQCEKLHTKLEKAYSIPKSKQSKGIKYQILRLNNFLNNLLVKLMQCQWTIELACA